MNQQAIVDDPALPSISLVDESLLPSSPYHQPYHTPSPAHSASPEDIPYQPSNDYGYQPSPSPSAHNFGFGGAPPGTPSYHGSPYGSRHNSPLGDTHSWAGDGLDLDPLDGTGAQLHMFDNNDGPEEYNPSEYDIPASTNPAHLSPYELMADEFDFSSPPAPSVSIDPADTMSSQNNRQHDTQQQQQDTSPASSAGLDNPRSPSPSHIMPQQHQRSRSRASSIASSHGSPNSHMGDHHQSQQQQNPGFDPQWGSVTAPSPPPNGGSRSPPALMIPDNTQQNHLTPGGLFPPEMAGVPRLGIPSDSGGPGINLIPATPVSGGGNGVTAGIPFGGHFGQPGAPDVDTTTSQRPPSPHNSNSGPAAVSRTATTPPPPRTPPPLPLPPMSVPSSTNNNNNRQSHPNAGNQVDVHMWMPNPADQQAAGGMNVNMSNPSHGGSAGSNPPSPYMGHRHSPSPVPNNPMHGAGGGATASGHSLGVPYLKRERSKSDTFSNQQRPAWALGVGTWNTTSPPPPPPSSSNPMATMTADAGFMPHPSSADAYHTTFQPSPHHSPQLLPQQAFPPMQQHPYMGANDVYLSVDPSMRRARSDAGGHRRGAKSEDFSQSSPGLDLSFSGGLLAPPVSGHPSLMVPGEYRGRSPMSGGMGLGMNGGMGHHRRASSGSRAGSVSGGSSVRASPYPSPNASPMLGYAQLGPDVGTVNMGNLSIGNGAMPQQPVLQVARPHVTTSATQAASQTRRTSEATFTCPVPGCGSTFTRHFNLKGHMRSHNDERPFKCKWPGCEKGFARQHDCKRHEQLHLNIRPYTCEGCSRTFARMDALNRHLRSEGGAECAKHQQPLTEEKVQPKQEDPTWRPGAVLT